LAESDGSGKCRGTTSNNNRAAVKAGEARQLGKMVVVEAVVIDSRRSEAW